MPHATPTHMDTHTHPHTHSQSHTHLVMPASHYGAGRIMLVAKHCQTVAINAAGGGGCIVHCRWTSGQHTNKDLRSVTLLPLAPPGAP